MHSKEPERAIASYLAPLVEDLDKMQLDVDLAPLLLDDRPLRTPSGAAVPGFERAVWFQLRSPWRAPMWELLDDEGRVRAIVTPPSVASGHRWRFSVLTTERATRRGR